MTDLTQRAVQIAVAAHFSQYRKGSNPPQVSNLPAIVHPMEVMKKLYDIGIRDEVVLSAAVLHDVLEDNQDINITGLYTIYYTKIGDLSNEVLKLVEELTCLKSQDKVEYMNSFRTKSLEACIIKITDRFCNVCDFELCAPKYAHKYAAKADNLCEWVLSGEFKTLVHDYFGVKITKSVHFNAFYSDIFTMAKHVWNA